MQIRMFKESGGQLIFETVYPALSFAHGLQIAREKMIKLGLIGRHYIESSSGETASINN